MIKWAGFGKLLKQLFFISLISCFGLLGNCFVSAGKVQLIGLSSSPSVYDTNYDLTFLKGGGVLSNYLGQGKSVLAFNSSTFFWWSNNGVPYYYNKQSGNYGGLVQGYFGDYWSCDVITGLDYTPTNCTSNPITGDFKSLFQGFFQKVKANDYAYYDFNGVNQGSNLSNQWSNWNVNVCFSSAEIGRSLCFRYGHCYSNQSHGCRSSDPNYNYGSLVNSENLSDLSFGTINSSWIGYAPGQAGYDGQGNIDGESVDVSQSQLTGNVMNTSCTKQSALNMYKYMGYNDKMCYSSYGNTTDIFNGPGTSEYYALTGVDIVSLRMDTADYRRHGTTGTAMSYDDWFYYWRNTFEVYKKNSENYTNPFLGVPVGLFTLMGNVNSYALPYESSAILEFCDLAIYTSDYSAPYTGIASDVVCNASPLAWVDVSLNGNGQNGNGNGTVGNIGMSWEGITTRVKFQSSPSGGSGTSFDMSGYQDGKTFINNFFTILSDNYRFPEGSGNGAIPTYIIITLCALILFRFLSH